MKLYSVAQVLGYSAYVFAEECFEYNENHCYIADSAESLRAFMEGCTLDESDYEAVPVTLADVLGDYGVSSGSYAFEPEALKRFEAAARQQCMDYAKEPFDEELTNVDVNLDGHQPGEPPEPGTARAFLEDPRTPAPMFFVFFSTRERPFAIHPLCCLNPDRAQRELLLWFKEIPRESTDPEPCLSFLLDVHPDTWRENAPPQRSDAVAACIGEFLAEVTPEMKQALTRRHDELRHIERRLDEFTVPLERGAVRGNLVSYADALGRRAVVTYTFTCRRHDDLYLVEDSYCQNPDCKCTEAVLNFVVCQPASDAVRFDVQFWARLGVSPSTEWRGVRPHQGTEEDAMAVASAWLAENPDAPALLKTRYARIKEIGRRSRASANPPAPASGLPAEPVRRERAKVGRNDPCPCGSGRKYKKCCGA